MSPAEVHDRRTLIAFISELRSGLRDRPEEWQNLTLDAYLEAMHAWLGAAEGLRRNTGTDVDMMPSWSLAASLLGAGKIYE